MLFSQASLFLFPHVQNEKQEQNSNENRFFMFLPLIRFVFLSIYLVNENW